MTATTLEYKVGTLRSAGLDAKWGKTRSGAPIICARDPKTTLTSKRDTFWMVDRKMWDAMKKDGILPAFTNHTLLGDYFSI